jgi:hypothetical protein
LSDKKFCVFTKDVVDSKKLREFTITRKIINIENGVTLDVYNYPNKVEDFGGQETWEESTNEKILINCKTRQLWNVKSNQVIELNFSEKKQFDFIDERNTEIFMNDSHRKAILVDLETGYTAYLVNLESENSGIQLKILRKSKYEFWSFSSSQFSLYSFLHSAPLKVFENSVEKRYFDNLIYQNYFICLGNQVDLYSIVPRGVEKLETISNQNINVIVDQHTGKTLLQYKHGVLLMKLKDELNIFSFLETFKFTDLKFSFVQ